MLQNLGDILKGRRWLALLVLIPLALLFGLWGTAGLVDLSFGAPKYGLKVNGEEVPTAQMQQAWQERQSQYQQQLKTDIPPAVRAQLQDQLFDQYTRETLMRQRADERRGHANRAVALTARLAHARGSEHGEGVVVAELRDRLAEALVADALVQQAGERRLGRAARTGPARGHVDLLIPVEQGADAAEDEPARGVEAE